MKNRYRKETMNFDLFINENDKNVLTEEEYYLKAIACRVCPKCGKGILVPRKNSNNNELFLGCSEFSRSECNFTIDIDDYLEIATNYRIQHESEIKKPLAEQLFKNAEEALMGSIELYNKPLFSYKFQSCIILLINSWELLMKAIICLKSGESAIFASDEKHTIYFEECLNRLSNSENCVLSLSLKENLMILYDVRNNYTHFYCESADTVLYSLISKAIDEFIKLAVNYFVLKNKELLSMQYLPLFFNIKKTTIQELKEMHSSKDEYIKSIADRIINFANQNKESDAILYNVDVNLQTIKNITNADIVVGIDKNSNYTINLEKKFQLGNKSDKGLQKITLSDDEINKIYPYSYDDLMALKEKGRYKEVQKFIKSVQECSNSVEYCYKKGTHPRRKTQGFFVYSQKCYDEIVELMKK